MDVSHVRQRVQAIADTVDDPEAAHSLEDDLFVDVLKIVASENSDDHVKALAGTALEARKIKFERWMS